MNKITNFGQQGARIREEADAVSRKKKLFFERSCLKFQYVLDVVAGEQVSVTLL